MKLVGVFAIILEIFRIIFQFKSLLAKDKMIISIQENVFITGERTDEMRKLRLGIIGAGQIVETTHMPNYIKYSEDVETLSIIDVNLERAKYMAEKFNIPYYFSSYEEMFKMLSWMQLVYVLLINFMQKQ